MGDITPKCRVVANYIIEEIIVSPIFSNISII